MQNSKIQEKLILIIVLAAASILRFYNLMHDAPYFFNPDERNMAGAIIQLRLPANFSAISCLKSEFIINKRTKPTTQDSPPLNNNCDLNPHFFAYGQFPLYLAFTSDQILQRVIKIIPTPQNPPLRAQNFLSTSFPSAIFWLRFYSALSSTFTVLLIYLISKQVLNKFRPGSIIHHSKFLILGALLAAFSPGLVQAAHFGTTESLLTFFFLASVFFSIKYLDNSKETKLSNFLIHNSGFIILNSIVIGLALGSKLTGMFFFIPPGASLIIQIIKLLNNKKKHTLNVGLLAYPLIGLLILIGSLSIFILSSPYNLIDPESFKSAVFGYEADVATGKFEAFYTRQFVTTTPILFQMEKIFPYALGWPIFVMGTFGFLLINLQLMVKIFKGIYQRIVNYKLGIRNKKKEFNSLDSCFFILTSSFLIYLLPNAFLFAKWTRFMTPIFPFFSIFAIFPFYVILNAVENPHRVKQLVYWFIGLLVFISLIPGIAFMSVYSREDVRVTASRWIYKTLPENSYILFETGNVVDIPLGLPDEKLPPPGFNLTGISYDFYHLDENPYLFQQLLTHLEKADYIFIPSRRIFSNYLRLPEKYPLITKYYQLLFSGALGFEKTTEISSFPSLSLPLFPKPYTLTFPDELSEETFTVFDHPVIRIYKKIKPMNTYDYKSLFER